MKITTNLHVVILAAGKGVRMRSAEPKVLHKIGGAPMILHVLKTAASLMPEKIHLIYGAGGDMVKNALLTPSPIFCEDGFKTCSQKKIVTETVNFIEQKEQLGTGHAVLQVLPFLPVTANVLILFGDVPLITRETLNILLTKTSPKTIGILTTTLTNPTGFGRIFRAENGGIARIIEEKDTTPSQKAIQEINTGIFFLPAKLLHEYLPKLTTKNQQQEYYLTDIIGLAAADKHQINGMIAKNSTEVLGVNDKMQLATLERHHQKQSAEKLMQNGVTLLDPSRFDLRGNLTHGDDVIIDVNVVLEGEINIGKNSIIGANSILKNVRLGNNVIIEPNCVLENCIIDDAAHIGPFARIRPGTHIQTQAKIGNFVEIKKSNIGQSSKINHLSYIGDSLIGENVNIGAGTITCNYDGAHKYQTTIEDGAFIGSNTSLVAPVCIGKNATIGAGSTITSSAPAEKLTLSRPAQTTINSWQRAIKRDQNL